MGNRDRASTGAVCISKVKVTLISTGSDNALCTSVSNIGKKYMSNISTFSGFFSTKLFFSGQGMYCISRNRKKWLHSKEFFHLMGDKLAYNLGL